MSKQRSKDEQLKCDFSTANGRLKKIILFDLVKKLNLDICYRCNNKICSFDELSVDHKLDWLHSDDPITLFYDLNNIAFSHLDCNVKSRKYKKGVNNHPRKRHLNVRTKSGYKGVHVDSRMNKPYFFKITMSKDGKTKVFRTGGFATPEEAARGYDEQAVLLFGEKAVTNLVLGLI